VFAHLGCSTKKHNRPIIRDSDKKNWVRNGNEGYAYFTTDISFANAGHYWLQHILTYDKFDAFQPWSASLEDAKKKTNDLLLKRRQPQNQRADILKARESSAHARPWRTQGSYYGS
jgi:hypothetical protein